ncbi:MAG: hypothetical protein K1X94_11155 [Sandaracinaceae bacterium]|nr:hypothetical protein [Sandaracinaceae bacterium]
MSHEDPASPELERLVDRMRDDVLGPVEVEEVLRRVRKSGGPPPDGGSSLVMKGAGAVLAAAAIVTFAWLAASRTDPVRVPVAIAPSPDRAQRPPAPPEHVAEHPATIAPALDTTSIEPAERAEELRPRVVRRAARTDPAAEHALLMEARRALASDPARALELAESHRAQYPRGLLAQEREMIAIDALEALGRASAARARAGEFIHRWTDSSYAGRLRERGYSPD